MTVHDLKNRVFVLRIAGSGAADIRNLRSLLKRLLRQHGFRTLSVEEQKEITGE